MKKKIFGLLVILAMLFAFVACENDNNKGKDDNETPVATVKTVAEALTLKNNDDVKTTGVVFAKTNEGFYINDETAGILVKLSTANANKLAELKAGDEVEVSGKLGTNGNLAFVKNAEVTVKATGKTPLAAKAETLTTINALAADQRVNYGVLYTIVAGVSINEDTKAIVLSDDTSSVTLADANYTDYQAYVGKKITTSFVLQSKGALSWTVYAFADTAAEKFVNVDDVKENIYASFNLPTEVVGSLELPTSYAAEPSVVFTWAVKDGTALTIAENKVTVDLAITEDATVTLTLTLTSGTTSATKDYTVTVKAIEKVTLADATAKEDYVQVDALVVASGVADEKGAYQYIIVTDETLAFYLLEVKSAQRRSVSIGDKITFVAKWHNDEDLEQQAQQVDQPQVDNIVKRPCFRDIAVIVKTGTETVDYATMNAIRLETADDYQAAIDNNHELIKLYQVFNPYMVGSGSSNYSWNQFGPSAAAASAGLVNDRQFSLLIRNLAENGLDTWETEYAVPIKTAGAKQYIGTVMYVFSVYQTGDTKWSFILPCKEACYYDLAEAAKVVVSNELAAELTCNIAGSTAIPSNITIGENTYNLTWTSSDDTLLNASTGAYGVIYEDTTVELTATFTANEKEYSFKYTIKLLAGEIIAKSVSEALADAQVATDGKATIVKLEAYVATVAASSDKTALTNGIMITDGKKVIYIDDNTINVKNGDKIEIRDAQVVVSADVHTITNYSKVTVLSENNTIDYSQLEFDAVITNEDELVAFIGAHGVTKGLVVKFSADVINFVGMGTTATNYRYQLNFRKAASSAAAQYIYNLENYNKKSLVFSLQQIESIINEVEDDANLATDENTWFKKCGMDALTSGKSYEVGGTLVAVGGFHGNTLHGWSIIDKDSFTLAPVAERVLINREIEGNIETSINAFEAGTATLLDKVTIGSTEYAITWTSANDAVLNGTTGAYAAVTEETKVMLTAHYTVGETAYTYEVEYTLTATAPKALTVTEALALANEAKVTATGVVIAFISDGNSTESNKGFMIMDNANGKVIQVRNIKEGATYPAYKYDGTETAIAIGDSVELSGNVKVISGQATYIDLNAAGKVSFIEKVTPNFHEGEADSAVVVVNNDTELDTLIKSGNYYNKIIKIVATAENPLHASGSGTGATTICNFKVGYHYTDNKILYNGLTISTKSDVNAPNTDGTTTFSKALYGATRDDGKMAGSTDNQRVGTLYITICYTTSTYYQASIVNFANCSLTAK